MLFKLVYLQWFAFLYTVSLQSCTLLKRKEFCSRACEKKSVDHFMVLFVQACKNNFHVDKVLVVIHSLVVKI